MIYVPVDGNRVRRVKRAYKGVNGKAVCVASDNPDEIGLTPDEIINRSSSSPSLDTSYFLASNPMEDLPPMGGFHD